LHYKLPLFGYRVKDFTYITDANFISGEELQKIKGSKILVLNALQKASHISHFNLSQAIELAQEVGAEKTFFTHISHNLGTHQKVSAELPDNIFLAYDGLKVRL
jgi:phosphoribosyl 1,2-cyclic phosphate phosphodiesterase